MIADGERIHNDTVAHPLDSTADIRFVQVDREIFFVKAAHIFKDLSGYHEGISDFVDFVSTKITVKPALSPPFIVCS